MTFVTIGQHRATIAFLVVAVVLLVYLNTGQGVLEPEDDDVPRPAPPPAASRFNRRTTGGALPGLELKQDGIFFIDVASEDREEGLTDLTMCAVESAARSNPDTQVVLLRTELENNIVEDQMEVLKNKFPNLVLDSVDAEAAISFAGMDKLVRSGMLDKSVWKKFHLSDVLRVALLDMYGGTYLDCDAVSLRPLPASAAVANFVVVEMADSVINSMLRFTPGHPVLQDVARRLNAHFVPDGWADNGPGVLTEAIRHLCRFTKGAKFVSFEPDRCLGITGYPKEKFNLLGTRDFAHFVTESTEEDIDAHIHRLEQECFMTHLWGHRYKMEHIRFDFKSFNSSQLIYHIGKKYCPVSFAASVGVKDAGDVGDNTV